MTQMCIKTAAAHFLLLKMRGCFEYGNVLHLHDLAIAAGFLRCKYHEVTGKGLINTAQNFVLIAGGKSFDERLHQAEVAAAMTGEDASVIDDVGIHGAGGVVDKLADSDKLAVTLYLAESTENTGLASAVIVERGHSHDCSGTILEKHVDGLVVHHVIVTGINATAVLSVFQSFG